LSWALSRQDASDDSQHILVTIQSDTAKFEMKFGIVTVAIEGICSAKIVEQVVDMLGWNNP
jgi:hypothetical protein